MYSNYGPSIAERVRAYHWNPSLQRIIEFKFLVVVCLEDELLGELGEGYAGVSVEFFRVLGKCRIPRFFESGHCEEDGRCRFRDEDLRSG